MRQFCGRSAPLARTGPHSGTGTATAALLVLQCAGLIRHGGDHCSEVTSAGCPHQLCGALAPLLHGTWAAVSEAARECNRPRLPFDCLAIARDYCSSINAQSGVDYASVHIRSEMVHYAADSTIMVHKARIRSTRCPCGARSLPCHFNGSDGRTGVS